MVLSLVIGLFRIFHFELIFNLHLTSSRLRQLRDLGLFGRAFHGAAQSHDTVLGDDLYIFCRRAEGVILHDGAPNRRCDLRILLGVRLIERSLRFAGAISLIPS